MTGRRLVAGVVVVADDFGVRALLLRRLGGSWYDLPGGDLEPGEMPMPGLRRWFAMSESIAPDIAHALDWHWMQRYPLMSGGVGFVYSAHVRGRNAEVLPSRDVAHPRALVWRELSQVRHWAPVCPPGVLQLLVAATAGTPLRHDPDPQPIPETEIWPGRLDGQVTTSSLAGPEVHDATAII